MSKVLVDRELLDSAATWLEVHAPGGGCVEGSVAEDLRAILAQPAEAEGVEVVGWRIGFPNGSGYKLYEQRQDWAYEGYGSISYEVQDLMTVAQHERTLSALSAERDRLREEVERIALENDGHDQRRIRWAEELKQLRAEVERLREAELLLLSVCNDLMRHENADVRMVTCIELNNWLTRRAAMDAKEA